MKNNVIRFVDPRRSREEIREQACAWLARLDLGASPEDMEQLGDWLEEDARHARMLFNMAAMWDQAVILSELSEIFPLEEKTLALQSRRRRGVVAAAAAMLVSVMLLGGSYLGLMARDAWNQSFETAVGERRQIDLPDGSEIVLNTNTSIQVVFNRQERSLFLDRGEGFFTVARDEKRPFRVYVGSRVVEAVGTAFTVRHTELQDLEIMVTEGKVNFLELAADTRAAAPAGSGERRQTIESEAAIESVTPLVAGERVTIGQDVQQAEKVQLQPDQLESRLAWRVGMLVFQGDTLETVLQEVSRYTTIKLEAEESIRDIPVEGFFWAGDIDGLLVSMQRNFKIDSQRIGEDQILLTARRQEE